MSHSEDTYYTLDAPSRAELKDRGSSFHAIAFPIHSIEEFESELQHQKEQHFKASHHCPAYRWGPLNFQEYQSDDGEPSGSAGKPILGQLKSQNLLRVGAIVVRYFGGTKLGVPGLIEAYREATLHAIKKGKIVSAEVRKHFTLESDYATMPHLMEAFKKENIAIEEKEFGQIPRFHLSTPLSQEHIIWNSIASHLFGRNATKEELLDRYPISLKEGAIV